METSAPPAAPTGRTPPSHHRAYVQWIQDLCAKDPGARVALRRGLRRGLDDVPASHRIVAAWLPDRRTEAEERAYYAIASLIADRPRHSFTHAGSDETPESAEDDGANDTTKAQRPDQAEGDRDRPARSDERAAHEARRGSPGTSLGLAFARAVEAGGTSALRPQTAETRLTLLTRQSLDGLHRHLPASVRHLRQAGVAIDYAQLMADLTAWPTSSKRICRRWLQDYYRARARHEEQRARAADLTDTAEADETA
ncbi:type I-E CRISPR-associated protein Cse2/CasB [Streptomyces sp. NPDC047014]|uniref:type I-E CRISPR-associated protein Cse2/CasB n=1 Tax=Streptomyces sp. NPDC047014 TaxID=3155736 RepID=UPI0033F81797